jgi:hypothetical protein
VNKYEILDVINDRYETVEAPYGLEKPCRLWTGAQINSGRGVVRVDNKLWLVHRFMYFAVYGPPENQVNHKCDRGLCLEPTHLYDGTHLDNMKDMTSRGRGRRGTGSKFFQCGHEISKWGRLNGTAHGLQRYRCNLCKPRKGEEY